MALGAHAVLTVSISMYPEVCGYGNGAAFASASGGTPPYSYSWDNGGTGSSITGLLPGTYAVTVTDNVGAQATSSTTVTASNQLRESSQVMLPTCPGQCTGEVWIWKDGLAGSPPYTFDPPGAETTDHVAYYDACAFGQSIVHIVDQNGCSSDQVLWAWNAYSAQVAFIQLMPSCQGSDGHVIFTLDFTPTTTLRVFDNFGVEVYSDPDPPGTLPDGPAIPITVGGLAPGDYFIRCITEELPGEWCYNEYPFTIQDLGTDCGRITGALHVDADEDCVFDAMDESGMPYRMLVVEPGPLYGITNAFGSYTINLNEGSYTIENQDADLFPICPAIEPVPFDITLLAPVVIQDFADSSAQGPELEITCTHSEARPGFVYHAWLSVKNLSPYWAYPSLTFTHDPLLTFLSGNVGGASVSAGQVAWANFPYVVGFGTRVVHLQFQVPADAGLIGTVITSTGTVQQVPAESNYANNSCTESVTIIGSYDPNDKTAVTSSQLSDELYFIDQDTSITYVIRFQNTGTASAINVEVTDTLPPELDPATMRLLGWSHTLTDVQITEGPVMHWLFNNIYLPDSGFNEAASHGFVSFNIKPHQPVLPGTVITNTANIFFDFNDPVITEPSVLTAEFSTQVEEGVKGDLRLYPNPATDRITIAASEAIAVVRLIAADGRVLQEWPANKAMLELELDGFGPGLYRVECRAFAGQRFNSSFIKL